MTQSISMHDLKNKLGQIPQDEIILDVRNPDEYAAGHIPGSRNIPLSQLLPFVNELKKYKKIYIHCQKGGRAQMANQALTAQGLTNLVCIANSGMADWLEARYPIEK